MNATVLGLLFVSNSLVLDKICALFFLKHVKLFFDALLLVVEKLLLKLVNLSLFVLVDIIEFTLLKIIFTVLVL